MMADEKKTQSPPPGGSGPKGGGPGVPRGGFAKPKNLKGTMVRVLGYVAARPLLLVLALACVAASAVAGIAATYMMRPILNQLTDAVKSGELSKMFKGHGHRDVYVLETADIAAALTQINEFAAREQGSVHSFSAETTSRGHRITFRADFGGRHKKKHQQQFFAALAGAEQTLSLHMNGDPIPTEL